LKPGRSSVRFWGGPPTARRKAKMNVYNYSVSKTLDRLEAERAERRAELEDRFRQMREAHEAAKDDGRVAQR
jgi:hypothetical protein